jgi:DNA polymerase I-like protein with 3'-5' exonuclease and polymerase domains
MRKRKVTDGSGGITGLLFEPVGDWRPPASFPNLSGCRSIGLDIETRDPNLRTRGPGFIRGDADVVGFSVAADDRAWYFPFGHLSGGNLDRDMCVRWLGDLLKDDERYIVGANLQYELEGLWSLGIDVRGRLLDVQVAEALINEERDDGYDLGTLAQGYLGRGKDESLLIEAAGAYGVDPKGGLWKLHSKYVGPYGEWDAQAPLKIFARQLEVLKREDLTGIFELESRLLPILWKMRLQGIPVDLERAGALSIELTKLESKLNDEIMAIAGRPIDVWSGSDLESLCDQLKITFLRTEKGNASFTGEWLEEHTHPVMKKIAEARGCGKMRRDFVDGWIFKNHIRGWVHPQWKQLARDDGGTRTGRMACSNPNAQQVPAEVYRDGTPNPMGAKLRACFHRRGVPWAKIDYSQQEPRILVHFAELRGFRGAKEAGDRYRSDRKTDIYQFLADMAKIKRRHAKDMTLGRMYGMGIRKMADKIGSSIEDAKRILGEFDEAVPFVSKISEEAMNLASTRGWIRTICGRKRHFDWWEPARYSQDSGGWQAVCGRKAAEDKWPKERLRRANTHKALNSLIQGSAADMTKMALVQGYEQQKRLPYMQVHDELDGPAESQNDAEKWQHLCENCVELRVPVRADLSYGEHWK